MAKSKVKRTLNLGSELTVFFDSSSESESSSLSDGEVEIVGEEVKVTLTTTMHPLMKKAKVEEDSKRWQPISRPNHSSEGKDYLSRNMTNRGIFDYYMTLQSKKGSNFTGECLCCGYVRTGSAATLLRHFSEGQCSLKSVPEENREGLTDYLIQLAQGRKEKYRRNADASREARHPNEDQIAARQGMGAWLMNKSTRQQYLRQKVSQFFVAANMPALLAENPFFRDLLADLTGGKISDADIEAALKRKAVSSEMNTYADAKSKESKEQWVARAGTYGGSLIVDGWTAARLIGTIGVTLSCLSFYHVLPLLLSGIERSRAADYVSKLEPVVPWNLIFFLCTDGASNMIALGGSLQTTRFIMPNLCAAHGFSLMVHYIGKVFEKRSYMFSKVAGIIAFFNRSNHRLALLRDEVGSDIGFMSFCKTRMAYQTLALMRVHRLRLQARKAMLTITTEKSDDEEFIDNFSTVHTVGESLNDDKLFKEIEIFCRATLPVLIAMREADRGSTMAGFVYWLFYHVEMQVDSVMQKLEQADESYAALRKEISSAVRFVWDKRHRPVLTVAYLTNPLFQIDLSKDNVYELDENFASDIEEVFQCMSSKRFQGCTRTPEGEVVDDDFIVSHAMQMKSELDQYLKFSFNDFQRKQTKVMLAAEFWTSSSVAVKNFPNLAWCARRVHSMPVVTSRLERFFSHVGNVQSEKRASLDPSKAALFAAVHQQLIESRNPETDSQTQKRLVALVARCEELETEEKLLSFDGSNDEFADLKTWLGRIRTERMEYLYKRGETKTEEGNDATFPSSSSEDCTNVGGEFSLMDEMDQEFDTRDVRRSVRVRKPTNKLNL